MLLDTNHPRLTVVKPISLVYKQKNIRKPFSKNINESKWSSVSYLVVGTGEEPLPGLSIVLLLHSNLVYDSPTTGTPSRNAVFRIATPMIGSATAWMSSICSWPRQPQAATRTVSSAWLCSSTATSRRPVYWNWCPSCPWRTNSSGHCARRSAAGLRRSVMPVTTCRRHRPNFVRTRPIEWALRSREFKR